MTRVRATVALIAAFLGVALTLSLGFWQLRRAEYKLALQAQWDVAERAAAVDVRRRGDLAPIVSNLPARVRVLGRFDDAHSVWLDNRPQDGRAGFFLVTPLRLEDGSWLLVNRGWAARDPADRTRTPVVARRAGEQVIEGVALAAVGRLFALGPASFASPLPAIWQNLDYPEFERASGFAVARLVVQQTSEAGDGLERHWSAPSFGVDMHRGYAVQWFSLAVLIACLALWFYLRPLVLAWVSARRTLA